MSPSSVILSYMNDFVTATSQTPWFQMWSYYTLFWLTQMLLFSLKIFFFSPALKSSKFLFPEKALQSDKYKWFVSLPIRLNMQFCPLCSDNEGIVLAHGSLPPRKEKTERVQLQCPVCGWMQCKPDQCFLALWGTLPCRTSMRITTYTLVVFTFF